MADNLTRERIIEYGLENGYRARDINYALQKKGLGTYNPLTYGENIKNLPSNFVKQGKEFGRDLTTLGGAIVGSMSQGLKGDNIKDKFINAINSEPLRRTVIGAGTGAVAGSMLPFIGTVGGGLLGGAAALLGGNKGIIEGSKNLADAFLSTYGTDLKQISSGDVDWRDVAQGVMDNPFYASIDALSFGGAKALGKAGKSIARNTGMAQKIFPGTEFAELNRALSNEKLWSTQNTADIYKGYNKLLELPLMSREKIVRSIVGNEGDLSKSEKALAEQIKLDLRKASNELERIGIFSGDFSRDNTIAQYVMSNITKDTDLLHKDIMDIINGRRLRPIASEMFKDPELGKRINRLIDEGEKLYDSKLIAFLSQKFANTTDPLGNVIARHENLNDMLSPNYARIIGRATPYQQANVLDETLKMQLDRSANVRQAIDVFSNIINEDRLGIVLSPEDKAKYISAFTQSLSKDVIKDELPNFERALENSGIDIALKNAGRQEMYEPLKGFFAKDVSGVAERFNRKFKKNVLGIPAWAAGNRLGNWSMNAIEGVTPIDYADVNRYYNYIPDALKLQSSYNSYLGLGGEAISKTGAKGVEKTLSSPFRIRSINKTLSEMKSSFGRYKNSDKTIADKTKLMFDMVGDFGNLTASPIFELEAQMEFADRAANYIRQAKRYAKDNKLKLKDVLLKAKSDKNLFYELNKKVSKSLGDYYGRNYGLPSDMYKWMNLSIPFYRFPIQTLRTTAHAIANNPHRFAANVTIPARAGNVLSDKYINMFGIDEDSYTGGVPYKIDDKTVRTLGMIPTPIGIVSSRLFNPSNFAGMLNPLLGNQIKDILEYKKFDKTPTSPRYTATKINNPQDAINYKPTPSERIGFGLNEMLGTTYNPYIWATRLLPQTASVLTGNSMQPFYNTMQPILYKIDDNGNKVFEFEDKYNSIKSSPRVQIQNPEGYKKTTPTELLGGQVGLSTKANYIGKTKKSISSKAKSMRKKTRKNIDKNRGK